MNPLGASKCINHGEREAVARCPECQHYFCRECITEHGGRVICSTCLQKSILADQEKVSDGNVRKFLGHAVTTLYALFCLLILWGAFYVLGQFLLSLPADYHANTLGSAL